MTGVTRTGHAYWRGAVESGSGQLSAESGTFADLPYTFASRTAEKAAHTDPEELLATAHAGCFAMSLASVLSQAGQAPRTASVSAEVTLGPTPAGRRISRSEVAVEVTFGGSVERAWLVDQVAAADRRCPFSALIRDSGAVVSVNVLP